MRLFACLLNSPQLGQTELFSCEPGTAALGYGSLFGIRFASLNSTNLLQHWDAELRFFFCCKTPAWPSNSLTCSFGGPHASEPQLLSSVLYLIELYLDTWKWDASCLNEQYLQLWISFVPGIIILVLYRVLKTWVPGLDCCWEDAGTVVVRLDPQRCVAYVWYLNKHQVWYWFQELISCFLTCIGDYAEGARHPCADCVNHNQPSPVSSLYNIN